MTNHATRHILLPAALCALLAVAGTARAFDLDTYTAASALSSGRWVQVSVPRSGLYLISNADLKKWGFTDPSRVRVHGYGGQRISDVLSRDNYTDDLPAVQSEVTARGLVFYASGVDTWSYVAATQRWAHTYNPFTTAGYYYITEADTPAPAIPAAGTPGASDPATTFTDYQVHEQDLEKLGETGHLLLGEDFKYTKSREFAFTLPDRVTSEPVTMACQFVAKTLTATSTVSFTANGASLPSTTSDIIRTTSSSGHAHGESILTVKSFDMAGESLTLGLSYHATSTVAAAYLDYIEVNYTRALRLRNGSLAFSLATTQGSLEGASATTRLWDVTDPAAITAVSAALSGSTLTWTNDYTGLRRYAAWDGDGATLPSPAYVATVANQNLHDPASQPQMVIVARPEWASQAERLAALHRADPLEPLDVLVVDPAAIYHEFSSGSPDVGAFRRYFKMLYDRGRAPGGTPLRYALLMGKATYDNRGLSSAAKTITWPTLPTWQSDNSLDDNTSYTMDDIMAFLADDSGRTVGSDTLCIALGRIPVRSLADAKTAVDKIVEYTSKSSRTSWRNQVLLLADDQNNGVHMEQSESQWTSWMEGGSGDQLMYTKVYIDAFLQANGTYPDARTRMYNRLDDGLLWWNFVGHANPTSWTSEKMLTYQDINNLYLRDYPMLYAATCEFLNWDSNSLSGCEILYYTRGGGIIGAISAVRPVYITDNGTLGRNFAKRTFERDDAGLFRPIGEIYRLGKNNILDSKGQVISNTNKLRYVLLGDPALRLALPHRRVVLEKINGVEVGPDSDIAIKARQKVTLEGYICDPLGQPLPTFQGDVTIDIYDSEYSTTSHAYGDGKAVVFDETGAKLYSGRDVVADGRFTLTVAMPESVADNYRPAAINMYATSSTDDLDAVGVCRDFYVYGYDETAEPDTRAPVIDSMYLNHSSFVSGGTVNTSPMLFATVSDDIGINLSTQGVGHTMTLQVDGERTYTNVASYYTPALGSLSGTIQYPVEELTPGVHSLRLRVWDTGGNMAEQTIDCLVNPDATPEVYSVYTDTNPATSVARFYVDHNRPDRMMTVTIEVFNLLGQPLWSGSTTGLSDLSTSQPVEWDLTDRSGNRVLRGIYLYRATIAETGGSTYVTRSQRIAVAAP